MDGTDEHSEATDGAAELNQPRGDDTSPVVSVVIPVYNDPEGARTTLQSVVDQSYPSDAYEVLVVDNNSTDRTPHVIEEFERRYPDTVIGLEETRTQSSYAARNEGIRNASGSIVAFIDADMIAEREWLSGVAEAIENNSWDYLACNVELYTENGGGLVSEYTRRYHYNIRTLVEEHDYALTCSLAVSAEVFETVGLFDPRLVSCGDLLFGKLVAGAGFDQHFASDITLYHPARTTLGEIHDRYVRIGRGFTQLKRYYGVQPPFSLSNPWNYLPPAPGRVFEKLREPGEPLSIAQLLSFYAIEHLKTLSRLRGHYVELRRDETDEPETRFV